MDNRLFKIVDRPVRLRQSDLPLLARGLMAVFLKKGTVKTGHVRNLSYVRLEFGGQHIQVLAEDWAKIEPYLVDDSFSQLVVKSQADVIRINPEAVIQPPLLDVVDRQYYLRVLGVLQGLFNEPIGN
jgi:hypothetical protein